MELLFALLVFAGSTTITPGPNNIMMLASGVNFGVRKSLPHYLGICFGFPIMVMLVGCGLGFVFAQYPLIHQVINVIGIGYLLYLAWCIADSAPQALDAKHAKPFSFWQAFAFQWVNPKAWIMATGAVAAYTTAGDSVYAQVLLIAGVFFLVSFPCIGAWLCFGVGLKRFLKDPLHHKVFNITMAFLLLASVVPIVADLLSKHVG